MSEDPTNAPEAGPPKAVMTPPPNASNHRPDQVMFTNFLIYGSGVLAMVMAAAQTLGLLIAAIPSFGITCLMLPLPLIMGGAGYWLYTQGEQLIGDDSQHQPAPDTAGYVLVAMILCGSLYHCAAGVLVLLLLKNPTNRNWYQG